MGDRPNKNQVHVMGYLGAYTVDNVAFLKEQLKRGKIQRYFAEHKKEPRRVHAPRKLKGILFGCIQWGGKRSAVQFFVIRVMFGKDDVLVPTPLPLNAERHTDGKGIFEAPHFGDKSATRLLNDLIRINPEIRFELERIKDASGLSPQRGVAGEISGPADLSSRKGFTGRPKESRAHAHHS